LFIFGYAYKKGHTFLNKKQNNYNMRKRYDYRNDYKGFTKEQILEVLPYLEDRLIKNLGICQSNADDYLKRIIYLKGKLN
tara:strand:+ start:125 stop:364 length:240 start_codon:yes stop_codon:yes gene_type:complete